MNVNLFDVAERGYEAARELHHQRDLAAEEAFGKSAAAIENEFATNAAVILDVIGDVIFERDWADAVATLYASGRHEHAGRVLTDRIETHIKLRAIREAAKRAAKAAEDYQAERWLEREGQ